MLFNPDRTFAQAYLRLLDSHFLAALGYTKASTVMRRFMQVGRDGRLGTQTNFALLLDLFAEATGHTTNTLANVLASFYRDVYPALRTCIEPISAAPELVQHLRDAGYTLVIATNPVYPARAVVQRMAWAGLPDPHNQNDTYALITNADTMHFIKPDAAYYAEILARVGVEPDEALMVGDSERNDIHPARSLGMQTVHITGDTPQALAQELTHVRTQLLAAKTDTLTAAPLHPQMIEPQLRGNIGALYGTLADVQPGYWQQRPDPDEWSILQILCHLLQNESEEQRPRLQRILQEDNPFIVAPKPPGPELPVCDDNGYDIAATFVAQRRQTLDLIATIPPAAWARPARHSIFGLTTLLEMAHFTAQHDRLHLNQLCQTIGHCE